MTVETQISLNMTNNQAPVVVDVVQGEQLTRVISATLYDGAQPWNVPGSVKAGLAFRKPDGTGGLYDQLPDHSIAVTILGNNVKAALAPQVQSVAGDVAAAIVFMVPSTMERLATFPFVLRVAKDPSAGAPASNDYYKYNTLEEVNAAIKDVQDTANAATEAVAGFQQDVASALPITLNGAAVSTDMVSPIEHEVVCNVKRLNEFTINDIPSYSTITDVDKSTNTFSIINTNSEDIYTLKRYIPNLKVGDTVTVKWNVENAEFPYLSLIGKGTLQGTFYNGVKLGPITQGQLDSAIRFYGAKDSSKATYSNIKASINRDLAKEYYFYVTDLSMVTVSRYGPNLFNVRDVKNEPYYHQPGTGELLGVSGNGDMYQVEFLVNGLSSFHRNNIKAINTNDKLVTFFSVVSFYDKERKYLSGFFSAATEVVIPSTAFYCTLETSGKFFDRNVRELLNTMMVSPFPIDSYFRFVEKYYTPDSNGVISDMLSVSPNMTILTDNPNVTVEATYNADTKKYIDKKFSELQAAIISTGGNV